MAGPDDRGAFHNSSRRFAATRDCFVESDDAVPHADAEYIAGDIQPEYTAGVSGNIAKAVSKQGSRAPHSIDETINRTHETSLGAEHIGVAYQIDRRRTVLTYDVDKTVQKVSAHGEVALRRAAFAGE